MHNLKRLKWKILYYVYFTLLKKTDLKKKKTQTYGYFQLSPNNSPSILHRLDNIKSLGANSTFIFITENISPEWFHKKTKDINLEGKKIKPSLFADGILLHITETPIRWPPHVKSWLVGKDPDAGRGWGQVEKGTTEDEMAGWHHQLDEHWVWVNSGSLWWTGRSGVLRFTGSQRVRLEWATELNWTHYIKSPTMNFQVVNFQKCKCAFAFACM